MCTARSAKAIALPICTASQNNNLQLLGPLTLRAGHRELGFDLIDFFDQISWKNHIMSI